MGAQFQGMMGGSKHCPVAEKCSTCMRANQGAPPAPGRRAARRRAALVTKKGNTCEPNQARLRPQVCVPHGGAQLHAELPARAREAVRRTAGGVHQPVRPRALLGASLKPCAAGIRAACNSVTCSIILCICTGALLSAPSHHAPPASALSASVDSAQLD